MTEMLRASRYYRGPSLLSTFMPMGKEVHLLYFFCLSRNNYMPSLEKKPIHSEDTNTHSDAFAFMDSASVASLDFNEDSLHIFFVRNVFFFFLNFRKVKKIFGSFFSAQFITARFQGGTSPWCISAIMSRQFRVRL